MILKHFSIAHTVQQMNMITWATFFQKLLYVSMSVCVYSSSPTQFIVHKAEWNGSVSLPSVELFPIKLPLRTVVNIIYLGMIA